VAFDGEVSFGCISEGCPHLSKKFNYYDEVCERFKLYAHFLVCLRNWDLCHVMARLNELYKYCRGSAPVPTPIDPGNHRGIAPTKNYTIHLDALYNRLIFITYYQTDSSYYE